MSCPRTIVEVSQDRYDIIEVGTIIQTGAGNQEVFIDETPAIDYPAISFTEVPGVSGLHDLQVHNP